MDASAANDVISVADGALGHDLGLPTAGRSTYSVAASEILLALTTEGIRLKWRNIDALQ